MFSKIVSNECSLRLELDSRAQQPQRKHDVSSRRWTVQVVPRTYSSLAQSSPIRSWAEIDDERDDGVNLLWGVSWGVASGDWKLWGQRKLIDVSTKLTLSIEATRKCNPWAGIVVTMMVVVVVVVVLAS